MRPTNLRPLALFTATVLAGVLAIVALAETHSWWVMAAAITLIVLLAAGFTVEIWNAPETSPTPAHGDPPARARELAAPEQPGADFLGPDARTRVLLVTSEPVPADAVLEALKREMGAAPWPSDLGVMVVSPEGFGGLEITNDQAHYDAARSAQAETVASLWRAEVMATGHVGDHDAVQAIADALELFPAERVLVFAHGRYAAAYRRAVDPVPTALRLRRPVQLIDGTAEAA